MRARELRQYQYFLTLAQELHFGRAAELSHITQSALSQQIGKLEESMGVKLLVRDQRQVRLTAAGQVLRDGAQQMFRLLEETTRLMHQANGTENYRVAIGMVEYANMSIVPSALRSLQTLYPELQLVRHELSAARQITALQRAQIDIGFGGDIPDPYHLLPADGSVSSYPLLSSGWRLLVPDSHPLASHSELSLRQLSQERIIMQARELNPSLYDAIRHAFQAVGADPHVVYETCQVQTGIQMTRKGLGCMLLAELIDCGHPYGMRSIPLADMLPVSMHMFWRTDESKPMLLDFIELAMEEAKRQHAAYKARPADKQTASWPLQRYLAGMAG